MNPSAADSLHELMILLVKELDGVSCRCGAVKESGNTFCKRCYFKLPQPLRRNLYQKLKSGYVEAYQAAVYFLDDLEKYLDKKKEERLHGNQPGTPS